MTQTMVVVLDKDAMKFFAGHESFLQGVSEDEAKKKGEAFFSGWSEAKKENDEEISQRRSARIG